MEPKNAIYPESRKPDMLFSGGVLPQQHLIVFPSFDGCRCYLRPGPAESHGAGHSSRADFMGKILGMGRRRDSGETQTFLGAEWTNAIKPHPKAGALVMRFLVS